MKDQHARAALRAPATFVPWAVADCEQSIYTRFAQQVTRAPAATAVSLPSSDVSYSELNDAAERAAKLLRDAVGSDSRPVALLCNQGYESIVWTLAVLRAGLPFAPLDQRLPIPTLRPLINDLDPSALLAAEAYLDVAQTLGSGRIPVVAATAAFGASGVAGPDMTHCQTYGSDVASVFYTSGSTGIPKGVADLHRSVLHNVLRYTNTLWFAPGDRLSLVQNPSFSGTASTLFGALLNGATVAPFDLQGGGLLRLSLWVRQMRITVFHAVPSIFRVLSDQVDRFPDLRLVRLEGDRTSALDLAHFRAHCQPSCTLVNGLGATECGLARQYFIDAATDVDANEPVPIGYAVPDVEVRVVDEQGRGCAAGAAGEIVVESRFLAQRYWRNPRLTNERFDDLENSVRRYRTGDLGRFEPDGCLIHLGRIDHRIRIAGEFVDTTGIEGLLTSARGVRQAVVHDYLDGAGERRLCAYVICEPSTTVTPDGLREFLTARTESRAVPSAFTFLDQFPLTKNGKVDRRKLPKPRRQRPALPNKYVAPQTRDERRIAQVWSEVLEIEPIGVTDSLLTLGGDSIHAVRIVNQLRPIYGERIGVTSMFEHPTIRALSQTLELDKLADRSTR